MYLLQCTLYQLFGSFVDVGKEKRVDSKTKKKISNKFARVMLFLMDLNCNVWQWEKYRIAQFINNMVLSLISNTVEFWLSQFTIGNNFWLNHNFNMRHWNTKFLLCKHQHMKQWVAINSSHKKLELAFEKTSG